MLKQLQLSFAWVALVGLVCGPIPLWAQSTQSNLSDEQLDTLLAPIALYPDPLLAQILPIGCSPVDGGDAVRKLVERDRCAPEDFYSTSNHHTSIRLAGDWIEVQNQRMDAMIVVSGGAANCRRLRDVKAGDKILFGKYSGTEIKIDGEEFLIMREEEVLGIVKK